jgi:hypothetical protein
MTNACLQCNALEVLGYAKVGTKEEYLNRTISYVGKIEYHFNPVI